MSEIHGLLQQSFQTVTKLPLTKMTSCLESSSSHQTVISVLLEMGRHEQTK